MILFPIAVADELLIYDLIPTSLLLQLEAGRNFETFIASTSGLKPFSSTADHCSKGFWWFSWPRNQIDFPGLCRYQGHQMGDLCLSLNQVSNNTFPNVNTLYLQPSQPKYFSSGKYIVSTAKSA